MSKIRNLQVRELLDSRGIPTVEVEIAVDDPKHAGEIVSGRALVPSGASTGEGEALELRDGDKKRFEGKGVLSAVRNVREKIAPAILGRDFSLQSHLDDALRDLDGTPNKSKLGANAILSVSMAFLRAQSAAQRIPTYKLISSTFGTHGTTLPVPMMNILNGGKHAANGLAIQEFMVVPAGFETFSESLRAGVEIFHRLKHILNEKGLSTGVGDEGGFAPVFEDELPHEQALTAIIQAIRDAGYRPGSDVFLAIDAAASEFSDHKGAYRFEGKRLNADEMVDIYRRWTNTYPVISIEDGLAEDDWDGWAMLSKKMGSEIQIVGDDLFVTNQALLKRGIDSGIANAILIKLNQIGTVTETLETMKMAGQAGFGAIVSHRSGETEDTLIADLAVGTDCGQIKTGSASRSERIAKYNQLLRIEEQLGSRAKFAGPAVYGRFQR
ncbi:MAG: phosphopyruvate hydratase [Bdellovibrionales bacterium RIFOXYC1_FULL_54_43]|nr:MAG: phosphopyruvate hydratase [Bdellovibrionales bacterium RIFOXYC1_FULL_54_43]OFZ84106.1 MAG: phosphopyruvate hydratase [Bdellovibrionales bacterium RIFOXYD1_FULL_55_31]